MKHIKVSKIEIGDIAIDCDSNIGIILTKDSSIFLGYLDDFTCFHLTDTSDWEKQDITINEIFQI